MHAFNLQAQPLSLAERLADFAVEALIDEADLSPKPALVDRRGNGAHSDLHLGLMHASALSLWPMFKEMAEAAIVLCREHDPCGERACPRWAAKQPQNLQSRRIRWPGGWRLRRLRRRARASPLATFCNRNRFAIA